VNTTICTIGFAGKTAEEFFGLLTQAGVQKLIDIRENRLANVQTLNLQTFQRLFPQQALPLSFLSLTPNPFERIRNGSVTSFV
jgi:hypothetical protein